MNNLLEFVSTVVIPATTSWFVAKNKFVKNTKHNAPVRIFILDDDFHKRLFEKVEKPITKQILRYHTLLKFSADVPIIAELGGEDKAESTLSELYFLMEKQRNGEDGVLPNDFSASIFYIRDVNDVLCSVVVDWSDHGWRVGAYKVQTEWPAGWHEGNRVFSRNSVLEPSATAVQV